MTSRTQKVLVNLTFSLCSVAAGDFQLQQTVWGSFYEVKPPRSTSLLRWLCSRRSNLRWDCIATDPMIRNDRTCRKILSKNDSVSSFVILCYWYYICDMACCMEINKTTQQQYHHAKYCNIWLVLMVNFTNLTHIQASCQLRMQGENTCSIVCFTSCFIQSENTDLPVEMIPVRSPWGPPTGEKQSLFHRCGGQWPDMSDHCGLKGPTPALRPVIGWWPPWITAPG